MKTNISRRSLLIGMGASALLTGCGFKLRGQFNLPPSVSPMFIEGGDFELKEALEDGLRQNEVAISETPDGSAVLRMLRSEFERNVRTTDSQGLATGYTYRYNVEFEIEDNRGTLLRRNQKIQQIRSVDYDPSEQLQVEEEEEFLKEEMEQEISLQILRRLSRL
ncbi:MAG: LPS assembly lipoprotein LptE [Pseudomonadota bacterium]